MATAILTTCNNQFEAHLIKGKLENNGIECYLTNENFTTLMPHHNGIMGSGIQIIVDENDLQEATKLIAPEETANKVICPNCQSSNVVYSLGSNKVRKVFLLFLSLLFWMPFGNIRKTYYCEDCRTEFKIR